MFILSITLFIFQGSDFIAFGDIIIKETFDLEHIRNA